MRAASLADIPAVRRVLGRAFENDPLFAWIFPDDEHRLNATAAWLGLFAEAYVDGGRVDVLERDGEIAAVAAWRPPGYEPVIELPTVDGLVAALIGSDRAGDVFRSLGGVRAAHSPEPHAYLHLLAVAPEFQRRGLGRQVIAPGLDAAREGGFDAELATMNAVNVPFYESVGFEVMRQLRLEPDGPSVWVMRRAAS